jgi:hypothetical protein
MVLQRFVEFSLECNICEGEAALITLLTEDIKSSFYNSFHDGVYKIV